MRLTHCVPLAADPPAVFDAILEALGPARAGDFRATLGPVRVTYDGTVRHLDGDRSSRTAVLRIRGTERAGQGDADAYVTVRVEPDDLGSVVSVHTELTIRGKAAQHGAGSVRQVGDDLFAAFVNDVEDVLERPTLPAADEPGRSPVFPWAIAAVAVLIGGFAGGIVVWRLRRRSRR